MILFAFLTGAEEEDVIRCVCGLYKDEGFMIQCDRCLVWQHGYCVNINEENAPDSYLCERCEPRDVNYEILMDPQPEYATGMSIVSLVPKHFSKFNLNAFFLNFLFAIFFFRGNYPLHFVDERRFAI